MAFPPNYNQERNNRARDKQRKAIEKQNKRDEKSQNRKASDETAAQPAGETPDANKD